MILVVVRLSAPHFSELVEYHRLRVGLATPPTQHHVFQVELSLFHSVYRTLFLNFAMVSA